MSNPGEEGKALNSEIVAVIRPTTGSTLTIMMIVGEVVGQMLHLKVVGGEVVNGENNVQIVCGSRVYGFAETEKTKRVGREESVRALNR